MIKVRGKLLSTTGMSGVSAPNGNLSAGNGHFREGELGGEPEHPELILVRGVEGKHDLLIHPAHCGPLVVLERAKPAVKK